MLTPQRLAAALPLNTGDRVLLASNVERLLFSALRAGGNFDLDEFIDALKIRIGASGTLLFPTYNWDFCHGATWDYHHTPSRTGSLSQAALNRADFMRTRHPIYSWAVCGEDSARLVAMQDSNSFVGATPFDYLYRTGGKFISLDVDLTHSFTFVHYVEEDKDIPYRFKKNFTARYIDENGTESVKSASMYVRYLDRRVVVDFSGFEEEAVKRGLMLRESIDDVVIRAIGFHEAYDLVAEFIENGDYAKIVQLD